MTGLVVNGTLEMLTVYTGGLEPQNHWFNQLTQKYGKPDTVKEKSKQNAFGAVFSSCSAVWDFKNLYVQFEETTDTTDLGIIEVSTNEGIDVVDDLAAGRAHLDHPSQTKSDPKL